MSEVSGCAHAVPAGTIGAIGKTAHAHRPQPAAEAVHRNSAARMVDLSHALVEQYTHAHHDPGQHADHHRGIGRHEGARSGNRHQAGQHPVAGHGYLPREDVPAIDVDAERKTVEEISINEGKPAAALPKIIEGRLNGWFKERVLLDQAYIKDEKQTVAKFLGTA